MKEIYYMETGSVDPYYNLAFEEFVLQSRKNGDYLLLWQNDNTIVIGQNQNAEEEINRAFVEAHHIHVVRRSTGGGAVYHDLGNLNYSLITDVRDAEHITMSRFTAPVVRALRGLGLQAEASGRNDILVNGFKVSGAAQRVIGKRILHHGTLLFSEDRDMMAGALRVDPQKFRSKSIKSVRTRVGNIRDFLANDIDMPTFWRYLKENLSEGKLIEERLSSQELREVRRLQKEKYDTWEWNFGCSPPYDVVNKKYWDGGCIEARITVDKGKISDISFCGDFMSVCSLEPITGALRGCPIERATLEKVLAQYDLKLYFGSITAEEVIRTILHTS